jgi:Ferritin-like domain
MNRAALLRRGVAGGALLAFPRAAAAADVPDADLSYLRLLVGAELLKADFQRRALSSDDLSAPAARLFARAAADDRAHYAGLAALLSGAGQTAATADDIDFSYPRGSFASQRSIVTLASKLARLTLGGYLGAVENVQTPQFRLPLGQIAANEAQQVGALAHLLGRPPVGAAFAEALQIDAVSSALDAYES